MKSSYLTKRLKGQALTDLLDTIARMEGTKILLKEGAPMDVKIPMERAALPLDRKLLPDLGLLIPISRQQIPQALETMRVDTGGILKVPLKPSKRELKISTNDWGDGYEAWLFKGDGDATAEDYRLLAELAGIRHTVVARGEGKELAVEPYDRFDGVTFGGANYTSMLMEYRKSGTRDDSLWSPPYAVLPSLFGIDLATACSMLEKAGEGIEMHCGAIFDEDEFRQFCALVAEKLPYPVFVTAREASSYGYHNLAEGLEAGLTGEFALARIKFKGVAGKVDVGFQRWAEWDYARLQFDFPMEDDKKAAKILARLEELVGYELETQMSVDRMPDYEPDYEY